MKVNFVDSMKASHIFKDNFYALYQIKCILERILKDYININTFKINIVPYENRDYNQCKFEIESKNNISIDLISYIVEKQSMLKDIRNHVTKSIYTYYIRQLTGLRDLSLFDIYVFDTINDDKELFDNSKELHIKLFFRKVIPYLTYLDNPYYWIYNYFKLAVLERNKEHFAIIDNRYSDQNKLISMIEQSKGIEMIRENMKEEYNIKETINLLNNDEVKFI